MWYDGKLMTEDEVRATTAFLPSRFQVGEDACAVIFDENQKRISIPVVIVGASFDAERGAIYDLAFKIEGTKFYCVQRRLDAVLTRCADKEDNCISCSKFHTLKEPCHAVDCPTGSSTVLEFKAGSHPRKPLY